MKNSRDGTAAAPDAPAISTVGVERDEHGQRVAGRRGGGEVAADGAALRICGEPTVRAAYASAGASSATGPRSSSVYVTAAPITSVSPATRTAAQLGDPPDRDHVRRATAGRR